MDYGVGISVSLRRMYSTRGIVVHTILHLLRVVHIPCPQLTAFEAFPCSRMSNKGNETVGSATRHLLSPLTIRPGIQVLRLKATLPRRPTSDDNGKLCSS